MPIEKPSYHTAPVFYPENNYTIVKYLDITKYISLLHKRSLFFCRLDKLEDQFEGVTAKANFPKRVEWMQKMRDEQEFFSKDLSNEKIIEYVKERYETDKIFKSVFCVNCWNKKDNESAALWKIYSDFSKGIMIKSSISRLESSLENTNNLIHLSEIRYLNYDLESMPDGNTMYPVIHKQKAYSYEEEVRLIYQESSETGLSIDWTKKEVQEGVYIPTDINVLIEEIVISPHSAKWFLELVKDITTKYKLDKPIIKSSFSFTD